MWKFIKIEYIYSLAMLGFHLQKTNGVQGQRPLCRLRGAGRIIRKSFTTRAVIFYLSFFLMRTSSRGS